MKKIGIITIYDNNNYGNRLQNYATQEILKKNGALVKTIKNDILTNNKQNKAIKNIVRLLKLYLIILKIHLKSFIKKDNRLKHFKEFNKNIQFNEIYFNFLKKEKYDYFIIGSDQVWNPTFARLSDFDLAKFTDNKNKISFAASFGISELPEEYKEKTQKALKEFKAISVREDTGKNIIEKLTNRKDIEVLLDPTMLLTVEEWDKVAKKPKQLKTDRYILNYFLGELSEERKKEINRIASENQCEVINILDNNSPFYQTGPSEFLYLEKNAFLICTDSFHSSVFAILYNRPFIVFKREDKNMSMNSRIETLINKLKLENREFLGRITNENLQHNYSKAYEILEKEKEKSLIFLKNALDIE